MISYNRLMDRKTVFVLTSVRRKALRDYLAGIYREARRCRWWVQTVDAQDKSDTLRNALKLVRPDGVISDGDATAANLACLRQVMPEIPLVLMDHRRLLKQRDYGVMHDSATTARTAAAFLLRLDIPHYAYVDARPHFFWSDERAIAFGNAIRAAGKTFDRFRNSPRRDDVSDITALRAWLKRLPKPCGVFAATDERGRMVLDACLTEGIAIPDELSVLGVDNDELTCENSTPSLSSVSPDFQRCGELAAGLLNLLMNGERPNERILTYASRDVIPRESTRRLPRRASPSVARALEFIRRQATSGITVREVTQLFGGSRRNAEIRFRQGTGHSIHETIVETRLQRAREIVEKSRTPFGLIAASCGFSSSVYLANRFKRRFGMSMSALRQHAQA